MTEDPFVAIAKALATHGWRDARRRDLACYVALGDSFTAGTGSPPGLCWADRLAAAMRACQPGLEYRNLAVDGATSADVLVQLDEAVELEPDVVTVVCGANDVLRSTRPDPITYEERLMTILDRLRNAVSGIIMITATSPEGWEFVDLGPRTRARVEAGMRRFNDVTRRVAERQRIPCLDVVEHPGLRDRDNFAGDGLHPSSRGHARAAQAFARVLRDNHRISIGHLEGDER